MHGAFSRHLRRPPSLHELRAALWAFRAVQRARRQLRASGYEGLALPRTPAVPESASRGVHAVLRRLPSTCLERAFVLQQWRAGHGDPRDVVVGVCGSRAEFRAHAWLDDEQPVFEIDDYQELVRLRP